jgi:SagB-type dehydrogenase family enzyme
MWLNQPLILQWAHQDKKTEGSEFFAHLEKKHPIFSKCFAVLEKGAKLDEFIEMWEQEVDPAPLEHLFYFFEKLHKAKFLSYTAQKEGRRIATLQPFTRFNWKVLSNETVHLSRFAFIRNENGQFVLESPLAFARVILLDPICFEILNQIKEPVPLKDIQEEDLALIELLNSGALLESANAELEIWEFHDLLFHSRSRFGRNDRPSGGTFRFIGKIEPYPAVKASDAHLQIPLSIPKDQSSQASFYKVLEKRRSIRTFDSEPISLEELGAFLYRSAAVRGLLKEGKYEAVFRTAPSGGACHPIEIYPLIMRCTGIQPGLYRYDRMQHALSLQTPYSPAFDPLIKVSEKMLENGSKLQILFIFAARFGRTLWKYESMGYATILKDVGALMQTMYLVGAEMDLAPCANGIGDSDLFAEVSGLDYLVEGSVGEFVIGTKKGKI